MPGTWSRTPSSTISSPLLTCPGGAYPGASPAGQAIPLRGRGEINATFKFSERSRVLEFNARWARQAVDLAGQLGI